MIRTLLTAINKIDEKTEFSGEKKLKTLEDFFYCLQEEPFSINSDKIAEQVIREIFKEKLKQKLKN